MQDADQQLIQAARLKHERELGEAALQESRDDGEGAEELDDPAKFENLEEDLALTALVAKPSDDGPDEDKAPNPVAKMKVWLLTPVSPRPRAAGSLYPDGGTGHLQAEPGKGLHTASCSFPACGA